MIIYDTDIKTVVEKSVLMASGNPSVTRIVGYIKDELIELFKKKGATIEIKKGEIKPETLEERIEALEKIVFKNKKHQ